MTNDGKENIRHTTCTNHTTRSDRDLFRVCPSKLSKRELEDLYFSLLENNKQLKKTVNGQRDQIKVLTTKVNRMTVQKNALGNLNKDCCASTKAIINEQKESIADLKNANERLSDRIRLLNMRLCSAKQFLRRSPAQSTMRCVKCCLTPNTSFKNSSTSALNTKGSGPNLQSQTEIGSSQFLNKDSSSIKVEEIEASQTEMKVELCQQNKCRTVMDELKQKIENLEEELSKTHEQYSDRIRKLEEQMRELRVENTRARAFQAESDHRLEVGQKKCGELLHKLRDAEMQCDNLATELQIERSKVSELETQVKAADISSQVAEALEKHLKNNIMTNRRPSMVPNKTELFTLGLCDSDWNYSPPKVVPNNSEISKFAEPDKETMVKSSDDSGYAEKFDNADKTDGAKTDQNILDQIASLQAQLNNLKLSMKEKDIGDDFKNIMVDSLRKSKSGSNETYAAVGANSSHSDDTFHPTRIPIDQTDPSISRSPDVIMSLEDINRISKTISVKPLNMFDPQSKLQMSSPEDVPRIPYYGQNRKNSKSLNSPKQSEKDITSEFSFENHLNENGDKFEGVEGKNDNMNVNDYNINAGFNTKDDILNAHEKKRRRSSLKIPNRVRNKDLSVSCDQNKIVGGSAINIEKEIQENDNGKIHASFQEESDSSTVKEQNHYKNLDSAPNDESYLDVKVSEKECGLNIDNNKKEEEKVPTTNVDDNIGYIYSEKQNSQDIDTTKNAKSPAGSSSGDSTYTVEGKSSQNKMTRDATYQIENENKDANIQVQNKNNHLDACQGHNIYIPHIPHRDVSLFRTCSGTLRFNTTTSLKNKFRQCHYTRDSKADMHTYGCPGFLGEKLSVNGLSAKQSQKPIDTSTPNHQKTYDVEASAELTRSTSPDNTDHEISSLTDLPNEDKSPRDYISPGEEKPTSTFSDSYAAATTTDYGSLSLGEVPMTGARKLSDIQMRDKTTDSIDVSTKPYKMEQALHAISEELTRCRELLQGQLPVQVIPGLLSDYRAGRY